jgi:hypothetical protein
MPSIWPWTVFHDYPLAPDRAHISWVSSLEFEGQFHMKLALFYIIKSLDHDWLNNNVGRSKVLSVSRTSMIYLLVPLD